MLSGVSLCHEIRFEISTQAEIMNICHCSMCRKISGASCGIFVYVTADTFRWYSGEDKLVRYESSPEKYRSFCKTSGSTMPVMDADNGCVCITAGPLDDDPGIKPMAQLFAASKAPRHKFRDAPVSFDEFEPDDFRD